MSKVIIGCDPDSNKSGFAKYKDGKLVELNSLPIINAFYYFQQEYESCVNEGVKIELHIENLLGNRCSSFNWVRKPNKDQERRINAKISESVGRCKQAQAEVERIAEHFGVKVVHHPVSSKWKNQAGKKEFERLTGWNGRSNEDSRSAAWFGFIGSRK